jgi:hypothetical protein
MARKAYNDDELRMEVTTADKLRFAAAGLIFILAGVLAVI